MAKQARALRTYDRVLDAAAEEFARYGYANTNLQRIADRIGLTKGALYGHFTNKEELATALTDQLADTTGTLLDDARKPSAPARDRLRALVLALGRLFQTDTRALAALRLEAEAAWAGAVPIPLLVHTHEVVLQLVDDTQREENLNSALQPRPLADLIVATVFGIVWTRYGARRGEPVDLVDAMWNALARTLDENTPPR
ncbi:TetR/AcrR family transcriptional regulator [Streptomyces lacrimifluminis]|uniref:TetR family transcriptional regulator n=1 Tax=Streptomyces lacrimifluminis TaxID=1500077 RepID=A0A917NYT9_9ACTN|nr:TetR/AcrR family transcriptional regulator [Streptomyces lacrimifluminis]GGJ38210.1 TetR family transcriptional regulator [Streptomyces lacrimifluminis]